MDKELFTSSILQKIKTLQEEYEPGGRLRTPYPAKDIHEFFPLVSNAMKLQQEQDGDQSLVTLFEEMPENDDLLNEVRITHSMVRRRPGAVEGISQGLFSNERRIRNRNPLYRETCDDPDNPGMAIGIYGQEYDNWVNFTVWGLTNKIANERAMWFEQLMQEWQWYFQVSGVKWVKFEERGTDIRISPENRKVVGRPFLYHVRTEKITVVREAVLRSILMTGSL